MFGVIKHLDCKLMWMNGIPNHIHILVNLNATLSISKFVQEIKRSSSIWLKASPHFPYFEGWGTEYCAFSKSYEDVQTVINYIKNQEAHHKLYAYEDEMRQICDSVGREWVPEYYD
jgi:REP element-mobilizing transposase RayT